MRISCDPEDLGYRPDTAGWTIKLDGVDVRFAITADDVKAYVVRYVCDADGMLLRGVDRVPLRERINGKVEIIAPEDA